MILDSLSARWEAIGPSLGDHLWQSTLFVIAAGLLTCFLRRSDARARYWLWLSASVKFLIPFSLLVGLGSHLGPRRTAAGAGGGISLALEQVGQPFTSTTAPVVSNPVIHNTFSPSLVQLLPFLLAVVWFAGFLAVLLVWRLRWRQVSAVREKAAPMLAGRELDALRRLEQMAGMRKPLQMVVSQTSLEPGIFGIARPVLLWPAGISERLQDAHLQAILAHELWHVRRRDNLAAAMHMVVEAIFWFHPLVWWLGARLADERERACDEEVLRLGSQRQDYAESILKTCEFCVEAPLPCMSGVTGADLKKRIVRIMTESFKPKLTWSRKLLLAAIGTAAIAGPVVFGLLHAPYVQAQPQTATTGEFSYDVASIKPDHSDGHNVDISSGDGYITASGVTLKRLIELAYNINSFQLSGGPDWADSETYEVKAKADESTIAALKKLPGLERRVQQRLMVQSLLAERFNLKVSHSSKNLPIYALVLAKNGPKFALSSASASDQAGFRTHNSEMTAKAVNMSGFAERLSRIVGRKVIDKTGLDGRYDFTWKWTPERQDPTAGVPGDGGARLEPVSPDFGPSIFSALQEQLGLKLEPQKGPVETLVIDSVEKPSPN